MSDGGDECKCKRCEPKPPVTRVNGQHIDTRIKEEPFPDGEYTANGEWLNPIPPSQRN